MISSAGTSNAESRESATGRLRVIRLATAAASAGAPPAGRRRRLFAQAVLATTARRPAPAGAALRERRRQERARRQANRNRPPASACARAAARPAAAEAAASAPTPWAADSARQAWSRSLLASEPLANSRVICAWLALSCAMVAFSSSTCWPMAARSCAIDCNWAIPQWERPLPWSRQVRMEQALPLPVLPVARRPDPLRRPQWRARWAARRRSA